MRFDLTIEASTIINDVSTVNNIGQFSIAIGNLIKGDSGKSPYIDNTTKTWWVYNDTTKIYEDTGISVNDFLKKDGSIPLNIGYVPTTPLDIATKDYVDDQVTLYNVTNSIPLSVGQYYTLTTAIAAVPSALRKIGFEITFESTAGVWETYKFKGTIANWSVLSSWSNDLSLKIDKTSIKQVLGTSTTDVMSQKGITDAINQEVIDYGLKQELRDEVLFEIGNSLNNIFEKIFELNFTDEGYTYSPTGETVSWPTCNRDVNYYPVIQGLTLTHNLAGTGTAVSIVFYDKNKGVLSSVQTLGIGEHNTQIPKGAYYARFGTERYSDATPYVKIEIDSIYQYVTISDLQTTINSINRLISSIRYSLINLNLNFNSEQGQYLNGDNQGSIGGGGGQTRYTLDYYQVFAGGMVKAKFFAPENDAAIFYDSQKQFVRKINCSGTEITIQIEQDGYLRFTNNFAYLSEPYAKIVSETQNIQELYELVDGIQEYFTIILNTSDLLQGLLNKEDGNPSYTSGDYPNYKYCPTYFDISKGDEIKTNVSCQGWCASICFYNKDKQFVSSIERIETTLTSVIVPDDDNIKFVRFCTERYNITQNITAYVVSKKQTPEVVDLQQRVENLENSGIGANENIKSFFDINQENWIADETVKQFSPSSPKIKITYDGQVSPQKRFIALGFDDFRASDFSFIIPLLDKYGARAEFNRVHNSSDASLTDKQRINSVINGGHELGDHTWYHYKFPFFEPLFNGQDPSSPEGSQVPFPSNNQLRNDVGNGKNIFDRTLSNVVKDDVGYQAPNITSTWATMTDAECQQFRDYYSVMKDTDSNLVVILDILSNKYLGTIGSSRGSWDSILEKYTGGIYTGCKTSQNHEVWERILQVTNMFFKDVFRFNFDFVTWSLPGSKSSRCYFTYNNISWYDEEYTKRYGNLARFTSSYLKNQDGSLKERSWTEVLREFKYKTTHDTSPSSGNYCSRYQFVLNSKNTRIDALPQSTNRSISYSTIASEYTKVTDLIGTEPLEVQMYDGGGSFKTAIETWRKMSANGIIWGEAIDSEDTWSERMILEGLLKYAKSAGIEMITHAEAYDICFNHFINSGNLIYNPNFRNSAKEFMPTATTVPNNPDGFVGNCSVNIVDNVPILVIGTGNTSYDHYGIPIEKIKLSADVKGNGNITIYEIRNNSVMSAVSENVLTNLNLLSTITINDDTQFMSKETEFNIVNNPVGSYEQVFEGYGDKIIGVKILFSGGLQVKNLNMRVV